MIRVSYVAGEIRRRGLLHTTAIYVMASWIVLQVANVLFPGADIPDTAIAYVFQGIVLIGNYRHGVYHGLSVSGV